ncbi:hypothetical protein ENBRE01_0688 [Enteropsectra breve]|nr:hypothetical protein ENBRE01_0688 [Enteropsectra breve]
MHLFYVLLCIACHPTTLNGEDSIETAAERNPGVFSNVSSFIANGFTRTRGLVYKLSKKTISWIYPRTSKSVSTQTEYPRASTPVKEGIFETGFNSFAGFIFRFIVRPVWKVMRPLVLPMSRKLYYLQNRSTILYFIHLRNNPYTIWEKDELPKSISNDQPIQLASDADAQRFKSFLYSIEFEQMQFPEGNVFHEHICMLMNDQNNIHHAAEKEFIFLLDLLSRRYKFDGNSNNLRKKELLGAFDRLFDKANDINEMPIGYFLYKFFGFVFYGYNKLAAQRLDRRTEEYFERTVRTLFIKKNVSEITNSLNKALEILLSYRILPNTTQNSRSLFFKTFERTYYEVESYLSKKYGHALISGLTSKLEIAKRCCSPVKIKQRQEHAALLLKEVEAYQAFTKREAATERRLNSVFQTPFLNLDSNEEIKGEGRDISPDIIDQRVFWDTKFKVLLAFIAALMMLQIFSSFLWKQSAKVQ